MLTAFRLSNFTRHPAGGASEPIARCLRTNDRVLGGGSLIVLVVVVGEPKLDSGYRRLAKNRRRPGKSS